MPIREKIADGFAAVDELADDAVNVFRARMAWLLGITDGRIEELWSDAGVPDGATLVLLHSTPVALRDEEWMKIAQSMIAAAKLQAFYEIILPQALTKIAKHTKRTKDEARNMTTSELKAAAEQGVTKEQFDGAKAKRKQRTTTK